ncbi:hypothetical protein JW710_01515 [Candidatus Dojkabacteria bacterium]|nr:hypothetical protein [Candidatus Dojkabacteria bacterium]
MKQIQYILLSLVATFFIAPAIINILYSLKFRQKGKDEVDQVIKERKKKIGVPVMGGLMILISVISLYFVLGLYQKLGYIPVIIFGLGGGLGFVDDFMNVFSREKRNNVEVYEKVNPIIYRNFFTWTLFRYITWPARVFTGSVDEAGSYQTGMRASQKLFFEILLSVLIAYLFYLGFGGEMWIPIVGIVDLGWFSVVVNSCLLVLFSMGFSVTDGLDALSAGTHAIGFALMGILAAMLGYESVSLFCMLIVGSELTFYYFNIPPARVEMGDIGTIPLGMLFVYVAMLTERSLITPIIGFIFVAEVLSSILQWLSSVFLLKKIFKMAPIHHHFEVLGWSQEKIVMRFYFIAIGAGLAGILLAMSL